MVDDLDDANKRLDDAQTLYDLGREAEDSDSILEAAGALEDLEARVGKMEFRRMLGGRLDNNNAIVSVNAGAGGVDSQDWAQMLQRMYMRWGERHGFKVNILDMQEGE